MDTQIVELPLPEAEALRRVVDQVLAGGDAIVSGGGGGLLDGIAEALGLRRCRVLRAAGRAPGGLSLSGLMAQVTARADLEAHDDEVLERGFQALSVPDAECDRIVLLVDGAEALQRTALRYLQFTCRSAPALRLVLARDGGIPVLEEDEMASLRTRLAAHPVVAVVAAEAAPTASDPVLGGVQPAGGFNPVPLPPSRPPLVLAGPAPLGALLPDAGQAAPLRTVLGLDDPRPLRPQVSHPLLPSPLLPHPGKARRRRAAGWAAIGLGMAACVALGVVIGRQDWPSLPVAASQPTAPAQAARGGVPNQPEAGAAAPERAPPDRAPLEQAARAPLAATQAAPDTPSDHAGAKAAAPAGEPPRQVDNTPPAPQADPAPPTAPAAAASGTSPAAGPASAQPEGRPPVESALPAPEGRVAPAAAPDPALPRHGPAARTRPVEQRPNEQRAGEQRAGGQRPIEERRREPTARTVGPYRPPSRADRETEARGYEREPGSGEPIQMAPPMPAPWHALPDPFGRAGGARPIIGTFATDQNGVRAFRAAP